jgi:hypothetical protein
MFWLRCQAESRENSKITDLKAHNWVFGGKSETGTNPLNKVQNES